MEYGTGKWVVHFAHGLGQVLGIEERTMGGVRTVYYVIQLSDLTIWVPVDHSLASRLRPPSNAAEFREVISTLSEPAEILPNDYRQRNQQLQARLKEGSVRSWCTLLRDLTAHHRGHNLSNHDQELVKSVRKVLLSEWSFSLAITAEQAEKELRHALTLTAI